LAGINHDMAYLEAVLRGLNQAIVVCDQNARILLYNAAAKSLFRNSEAVALGRSLFGICAQAPIEHTLQILRHRPTAGEGLGPAETGAAFVCATRDGSILLNCHLREIPSENHQGSLFLFTFENITGRVTGEAGEGHLFDTMIKTLRAPITNLNAAAENLKNHPEMRAEIRGEFEGVIFRESAELTRRFEAIAQESRKIARTQWPLADVYSADLIGCLARRFSERDGIKLTMVGVPLWLQADSYSMLLVLETLVRFVHQTCKTTEIDLESLLGDRRVSIDIVWKGKPIPQFVVDSMLDAPLPETSPGVTVAEVLRRHDSAIWSQRHRRAGYALLRIPVPHSSRQWEAPAKPAQGRPVFYDFSIGERMKGPGVMADRSLASLTYVVFDTETTGLRASEGAEILAISAVRIAGGRILSGESFERRIRPQHPIHESSLPFIHITGAMAQEELPIQLVLPQFKRFVDDALLVAHNSGFDLDFFKLMEEETGVIFENPVLDTLLLSLVVEEGLVDYTLESIGRRFGVQAAGGHPAMDDCFVTAQVFLRLLELLEAQGIKTLGQAISACERVAAEKRANRNRQV